MYEYKDKITKYYELHDYISKSSLPGNPSIQHDYIHGNMSDLRINLKHRFMSKQLYENLQNWGLDGFITGQLIITVEKHVAKDIRTTFQAPRFKCDSREIFKILNDTVKTIKACKRMNPKLVVSREYGDKLHKLTYTTVAHMLLKASCPQDVLQSTHTKNYNSLIDIIESKAFRHFYKIIHPNTEIYFND